MKKPLQLIAGVVFIFAASYAAVSCAPAAPPAPVTEPSPYRTKTHRLDQWTLLRTVADDKNGACWVVISHNEGIWGTNADPKVCK